MIGIDFGTTNSLAAVYDSDRLEIIPNSRGARLTPSVVAVDRSGTVLVGESARNQAVANPTNTIAAIKRSLGDSESLRLGPSRYRPEEIAAFILGSLRKDAEKWLGMTVKRAVLTVPAWFSERERRALRTAGRLAGLSVERILNEPTAAAVAWAFERRSGGLGDDARNVLVYDLGGGTFDVTALRMSNGRNRVLASLGADRLGGIDFDLILRERVIASFGSLLPSGFTANPVFMQQLLDLSERAKMELSTLGETAICLPFVAAGDSAVNLETSVTRGEFESLIRPFVDRTLGLCRKCAEDSGLGLPDFDVLILSGGSSRIPLVRNALGEATGLEPESRVNPEEITAMGAAVEGAILAGSLRGFKIHDVASRTFGVEIENAVFVPVIPRNTPLPAVETRMFTTIEDGQDKAEIHVLQGESRKATDNLSLGRFLLPRVKGGRKGEARIEIEFSIDEDDILQVTARDLDTDSVSSAVLAKDSRHETDPDGELLSNVVARIQVLRSRLDLDAALEREIEDLSMAVSTCTREFAGELKTALETVLAELTRMERDGKVRA